MKKLEHILNDLFDILLLTMITITFMASGVFVVYQVLDPTQSYLMTIGVLIAIAAGLSRYYIWIKEQAMRE